MLAGLEAGLIGQWLAALAATGVVAGLIAGLLGVGGGIVVVPVLFQLLTMLDVAPDVRMHVAVGSSLAIIIPTAISSARSHYNRDAVDMALLRQWGPWVLVGVLIGAGLARFVGGEVLAIIFAGVAILVAVRMAGLGRNLILREGLPGQPARGLIATVIGCLSTLMGIGGGTLTVPALSLFNFDIRRAVGTASAVGLIIAVPGAVGFVIAGLGIAGTPPFSVGYVNLLAVALIFPLTITFAPLGARLAHSIPRRGLQLAFAGFLALVAVRLLLGALTI